ncbi:MAG: amidophosphoribosyltransferase [Phycisphaerae bacterium]|nr:amidophosphoribosyltransferase [Phycisphaerae bacterium]NUQ48067.1 amidophosphoribosyltransferase [Phycisphaerae bacterium]
MSDDRIREYCGLFGVFGTPAAAEATYNGLYAQQHRGQESAGICTTDGRRLHNHTALGLVTDVFDRQRLDALPGHAAIGHVRYSTTGSCSAVNAQPLLIQFAQGEVAVAHNGNLVNAVALRERYERRGAIFRTSSDTEVVLHLLADPRYSESDDPLANLLPQLSGAYCFLLIYADRIEAVRDPFGLRPLCLGRMRDRAWVVASETSALDIVDAAYVRDVAPGEIVTLSDAGLSSRRFSEEGAVRPAHCIFEQVYFADPSSNVFGQNVHQFRVATGRRLAIEAPAEADLVIPVPTCAMCAAQGFAEQSGLPLGRGFTVSHYAGRSFIMPTQAQRDMEVKRKLNVIKDSVRGKRLAVIEDSVVRGTTTRGKMGALREAGAREIHLRVASPPIRSPCYFGIDFPDRRQLIATGRSVEEIRDYLGVDSLAYLSLDGMLACAREQPDQYCAACFAGRSPIQVESELDKLAMERVPTAARA